MPVPTNPRPSLGRLLLQIAGESVRGTFLDDVDVEACRRDLAEHLLEGEDPAPFLRALEATEVLQAARRDLRDALEQIGANLAARHAPPRA